MEGVGGGGGGAVEEELEPLDGGVVDMAENQGRTGSKGRQ
jgi:hypothetical protein